MALRRRPRPRLEKYEQGDGCKLLGSLGGQVYTLGHARRRDDFQGTMQTPGLPDVLAFLPQPKYGAPYLNGLTRRLLCWEAKSAEGKPSDPQIEFAHLCDFAGVWHVTGDLNTLLAFLVRKGFVKIDQLPHDRQPMSRSQWEGDS